MLINSHFDELCVLAEVVCTIKNDRDLIDCNRDLIDRKSLSVLFPKFTLHMAFKDKKLLFIVTLLHFSLSICLNGSISMNVKVYLHSAISNIHYMAIVYSKT